MMVVLWWRGFVVTCLWRRDALTTYDWVNLGSAAWRPFLTSLLQLQAQCLILDLLYTISLFHYLTTSTRHLRDPGTCSKKNLLDFFALNLRSITLHLLFFSQHALDYKETHTTTKLSQHPSSHSTPHHSATAKQAEYNSAASQAPSYPHPA